jgi:manganese/zinc/iron transport system permease protein
MTDGMIIILTACLVATACCLLGPFLVLRRVALMGDAVSHAVLPGIVAAFLIFQTRAPLYVILGAAVFAVVCVLAIEALRATGLVASDAAIGLVFPALFALGVLGIHRYADDIHLDLDSTIYGEIAFAPFRTFELLGADWARSVVIMAIVCLVNLALVALLWKELKVTSFDPEFARTIRVPPRLLSRLLMIAVAVTAVTAFESVGAILVVTLLIVPAAAAYLLTDRLVTMVVLSVVIGWVSAVAGYWGALQVDASIAGTMGLCAAAIFAVALIASPRYGLAARALRRARRRRATARALSPAGRAEAAS